LKAVEEPPPHSFFCFCTTEIEKVPKTIVTRCFNYSLKEVNVRILTEYLKHVADKEGLDVDEDLIDLAVKQAEGGVRKALVNLSKVDGCQNIKEAEVILDSSSGTPEVIDLCRLLVSDRLTWKAAVKLVGAMSDQNPESVRIVVTAYVGKVLLNSDESKAPNLLAVLEAFSGNFNQSEKMSPVLLAIGRILWS
jgi:DNA polymerase III gamma/tau subunit